MCLLCFSNAITTVKQNWVISVTLHFLTLMFIYKTMHIASLPEEWCQSKANHRLQLGPVIVSGVWNRSGPVLVQRLSRGVTHPAFTPFNGLGGLQLQEKALTFWIAKLTSATAAILVMFENASIILLSQWPNESQPCVCKSLSRCQEASIETMNRWRTSCENLNFLGNASHRVSWQELCVLFL